MGYNLDNLDLIDLINEHNVMLRRVMEEAWGNTSNITISNSEWFIIARIYKKHPNISYITKNLSISRQGIHKLIKSLQSKGLVEINNSKTSKRDKCIRLTQLGIECYEKNAKLKKEIEDKISLKVGQDTFSQLKHILRIDWNF